MKKTCLIIIATFFVVACTPMVWDKRGATTQDYNKDSYECEKDSRQSGYFGGGFSGAINMQAFFDKCMIAHGWNKKPANNGSSGNMILAPVEPEYNKKLSKAESYCKKKLPKKSLGEPEYNDCVSNKIDGY